MQLIIPQPGLIKINLPLDTLHAARPGLEDLRLLDPSGREVPYLIERSLPAEKIVRAASNFQVTMAANATVMVVETGLQQPLEGVTLATPAARFIKAVRVEGSTDQARWQTLAQGQPIFRQANGLNHLHIALPPGAWPFLRLTVDDQRSEPIPFSGARVHAAASETPTESLPVTIASLTEEPGLTRLTLNLPAAHLQLASLHIETPAPLFTREVTVVARQLTENVVQESPLARGTIYRLIVEGQGTSSNLTVGVESFAPTRELGLLIHHHDSPPLPITGVRAQRRPVYLVFLAQQSGGYQLLSGNNQCAAPRYDLASLGNNLKGAPVSSITLTSLTNNPAFRPSETLPTVQEVGPPIELAAWKFRKPVKLARAGVQQLELDLEVLSRAQPGFQDLRLVREGRQIPYLLEHTSLMRSLKPIVAPVNDPKRPKLSRWSIKLTERSLPITRLTCASPTPLFQRDLRLYEEVADYRGDKFPRELAQTTWMQKPESKSKELVLALAGGPDSDTLLLETDNQDNPPIVLENFQCFYPATRIYFKTATAEDILLYYGNREADAPRYDLVLVGGELLAAEKTAATLAAQEQLKKSSWTERGGAGGPASWIFWGVLALVVAALLVIISRLLPKSEAATQEETKSTK